MTGVKGSPSSTCVSQIPSAQTIQYAKVPSFGVPRPEPYQKQLAISYIFLLDHSVWLMGDRLHWKKPLPLDEGVLPRTQWIAFYRCVSRPSTRAGPPALQECTALILLFFFLFLFFVLLSACIKQPGRMRDTSTQWLWVCPSSSERKQTRPIWVT